MNKTFINRLLINEIKSAAKYFHVITLTGPRQSGKTTLCRKLFPELPYVNFEDIFTLEDVRKDTKGFFTQYPKGVIIDEAHNFPQIFSQIQVEIDEDIFQGKKERLFVITGSSNFALLEKVTQSLAGRTAVLHLLPLSLQELSHEQRNLPADTLILNGGYPAVWTNKIPREKLFRDYYTTYIERDARQIVNLKEINQFYTFIRLCAGRIGAEFNSSALAGEVGVTNKTIAQWLNILGASYILYLLPPYFENIGKRLTKTPKIYFYDTGLAAYLLRIENEIQLNTHPLRGALFENMVINEMIKGQYNKGKEADLYFYRDQSQREIDVIRIRANELEAYEIKAGMSNNSDYSKHLSFFKSLLKDRVTRTAVIYNGIMEKETKDNGLYNFRNFQLY